MKNLFNNKIDYLTLFIFSAVYYGWQQFNKYVADPDAFYHAKMAELLKNGIVLKSLPWMQFSTLKDNFTDHQLLYHILLAPFTFFWEPIIAVKIATVLFAVINTLMFLWLLKKLAVKKAWVFSILLLLSNPLTYRLIAVKVNSLSLIMLWLIIYALFNKKNKLLALFAFIFVWLYGGWILALLLIITFQISKVIYYLISNYQKISPQKILPTLLNKNLLFLCLGLIAGIIINPYWPHNIYFYYQQIFQIGVINYSGHFNVGTEWRSVSFSEILHHLNYLIIFALALFVLLIIKINKVSQKIIFFLLMTFGLLLMSIKSIRYMEYLIPFIIIFIATAYSQLISFKKIKFYINKLLNNYKIITYFIYGTGVIILLLFLSCVYKNIIISKMPDGIIYTNLKNSSQWLIKNVPTGEIVYNSDWDEWPQLFYYDDKHYYIIGLDYTFLYNYDYSLHKMYDDIMLGKNTTEVSKTIKQKFKANYILVTKKQKHQLLLNNLENDAGIELLYEDQEAKIYKIK